MKKLMTSLCAPFAAVFLLLAPGMGQAARAQDASSGQSQADAASQQKAQTFGAWTVVCSAENPADCIAQQQIVDDKTQQILASATVRMSKEDGAQLLVQTPTGVLIAPGMILIVDGKQATKAPFTACAPSACESAFKIDQALINNLAKAKTMGATVQSRRGKTVNIVFELTGFLDAYTALRKSLSNG